MEPLKDPIPAALDPKPAPRTTEAPASLVPAGLAEMAINAAHDPGAVAEAIDAAAEPETPPATRKAAPDHQKR